MYFVNQADDEYLYDESITSLSFVETDGANIFGTFVD